MDNPLTSMIVSPTELNIWVDAVQAAVTAIRGAGASEHMILIPGMRALLPSD